MDLVLISHHLITFDCILVVPNYKFRCETHVPLLFFGNGIQPGSSAKYYPIIDIAPTLCNLLEIEFPNGVTGKVIEEALKN